MRPPLLGRVLFGLALLAFPRPLRRRYGDEMRAFLADDYAQHRRGGGDVGVRFWLRACGEVLWNGWMARAGSDPLAPVVRGGGAHASPAGRRPGFRAASRGLGSDLRVVLRGLVKARGYTVTTVLTLALAISASVLIFSVLHPVLLAPLPYPDSDRLMVLSERGPGPDAREEWVSPLTFRDWRERSEVFEDLVSYRLALLTWTGGDVPRLLRGWAVSAGFFPLMGIDMALGRGFSPQEDVPGAGEVVVLSHGFWARAFGRDREIIGKTLSLDGRPYAVVGVAGPELGFPSGGEFWVPAATDYAREFRDFRYLGVIGRIRPELGLPDAEAEMTLISEAVARENPATNQGWGVGLTGLKEEQVGQLRPVLLGMSLAVGLLFVIALGNVANLTLARGVGRRVDTAIRRALGAGGRATARMFLVEGLVLGLLGAGFGFLMAWIGLKGLAGTSLLRLPRLETVSLDRSALLLALGVAVLVGVILAGVSFLASPRRGLSAVLREGGGGGTGTGKSHRVREGILIGQVALALALLIGASLLTRSLLNLNRVDPGFEPRGLLAFGYNLPPARYPDPEAIRAFERDWLTRVQALPGVEAAGVVAPLPLEMGSVPSSWSLPPEVRNPSAGAAMAHMRVVSSGYIEAMGLGLLEGRSIEPRDLPDGEGVVLVNQSFVESYLQGVDPLGQRITAGEPDDPDNQWITVVGVVADVRFRSLRGGGEPELYIPSAQFPTPWGHLVVRSDLPREALIQMVTEETLQVDPSLALADILDGEEIIGGQLRTARLSALLTSLFAANAALLAAVGILGVLSIIVAQRTREIGLRKALGAEAGSILAFIVVRGLRPLGIGLGAGVLVSVLGTRVLESQIYGVGALDPPAFVLPVLGFLATGLLVALVPGARASSVNPVDLLRDRR